MGYIPPNRHGCTFSRDARLSVLILRGGLFVSVFMKDAGPCVFSGKVFI